MCLHVNMEISISVYICVFVCLHAYWCTVCVAPAGDTFLRRWEKPRLELLEASTLPPMPCYCTSHAMQCCVTHINMMKIDWSNAMLEASTLTKFPATTLACYNNCPHMQHNATECNLTKIDWCNTMQGRPPLLLYCPPLLQQSLQQLPLHAMQCNAIWWKLFDTMQ